MTDEQFTPLAERYMDTVFRVAYSYLRCRDDADDVTQDVLIQLYKEDKAFESDAHVKNWLIRVTVNRCKNVLRAPWHKAEDIADYENTLVFEQPQYRELFDAVMSLDRRYRLPVLLYYYEGYRQKEIADQYAEAERRRQEAEQAKLAYDQEIAQAKQKRDEIVREAAELAHRQERDILDAAREEAKAITAKAHSDIRQERRKVFNEMKTEISDIAIEIAEKVTEKEIDSDKHRELIDSFIDQIGEAS